MDHGNQSLSDHFLKQIKYWGVSPSFAFVEQPQTNGVAERFNKTLKEQAIYGRIFHSLKTSARLWGNSSNDTMTCSLWRKTASIAHTMLDVSR